jgi:methanogenic corrinoid protein MtbC1
MKTFGQRLKQIRKERSLRQKDLADALKLAQTTIANYEQSIRFPDETTLHALADYLGISLDYLMGRAADTDSAGGNEVHFQAGATELNDTARSYLEQVRAAKAIEAEELVRQAIAEGMPIGQVYLEVLQPALREVGRLWETGELDVSEEHYFSAVTEGIMSRIMSGTPVSPERPVFIGLAASGELHAIGIRMVTDFLLLQGWKALFLGTNLPAPSVLKAIRDHNTDVVGISAAMPYHVNPTANLIQAIRSSKLPKPVKVLVGGLAFAQEPKLWRAVGADGFAPDAARAAKAALELVSGERG